MKMNVPGVAWVGLVLLLVPVIQTWVAMQWPEASYPITALIVGVLAAVAKWLQMYFQPSSAGSEDAPRVLPMPDGALGAPAPAPAKQPSAVRRWLLG